MLDLHDDEQLKGQFTVSPFFRVYLDAEPIREYEVENVTFADNKFIITIKQNSLPE
jgi:hypothetical protein